MDEGTPVTLVSRDMVARIRAQMMGVLAEDFTTDRLPDGAQPYTAADGGLYPGRSAYDL